MGNTNLKIVCYMGGSCGDIVMSVIDPKGSIIKDGRVLNKGYDATDISTYRYKLKKPHVFSSDIEKDQFLIEIASSYKSIPSHDTEYHIQRNHSFITVGIRDKKTAIWAAQRFKSYHRPEVWEEMVKLCGATSTEHYADMLIDYSDRVSKSTNKIVDIEDILSGKLIEKMQQFVDTPLDSEFYHIWLEQQS